MAAHDIHDVLEELATVVAHARERRSRLGYFAALYRQVTFRVRDAIDSGMFDDGDRMSRFDAVFASRYLDALHTWQSGATPSRSWEVAFGCADLPSRMGLQHVLVGINAHINLDLAVAAAQHSPGEAIAELRDDFHRINEILAATLDPAQQVMGEFSPLLRVLDVIGARTDEAVLDFSIQRARDDAWRHAVVLAVQQEAHKDDTISVLDRKTAFLGRLIREPGGLAGRAVELISATESDDVVAIIDVLGGIATTP